jgi:hypothetical protein
MLGSSTKKDIWKACIWFLATLEMRMPRPSEAVDEEQSQGVKLQKAAPDGHMKENLTRSTAPWSS